MTAIVELKNVTKAVSNGMNEEKVILDDVPWKFESMILSRFWGAMELESQPSLIPLLGRFR